MAVELPVNLQRWVQAGGADVEGLQEWVLVLPTVVEDLAARWSLELGPPFQPGGITSWTAPVRAADGQRLVLKVGWRHDEALHEGEALKAWDGHGAVRLLDAHVEQQTSALLLEACEPGTAASVVLAPEDQDVVLAGLLRRLWITPPRPSPFRTLEAMCTAWASQYQREQVVEAAPALDAGLVSAGMELLVTLPTTAEHEVLLCTDLHAGNVLAARREPWLVIDPKPYLGDPTYDVLQHMLNHPARLAADPVAFVARMAGLLDLDTARLRLWLFARCVHAARHQPFLAATAKALAP